MISLYPNNSPNPWLPNNQQSPYDLATTTPVPYAYSALGTPPQDTYAVGTLPSTSGWEYPQQAPAPNTLLATNTQTYTKAPTTITENTNAPDTRIYAPETTINYDSTTNQYYITYKAAPAPVVSPPVVPPPVPPAPVYPPPPAPPKFEEPKKEPEKKPDKHKQKSKKKGGFGNILPWLIGGGGVILAALGLPKLFGKKDKVEAKAEATATAKATPEAVEKTPSKKDTVYTKLEINAHGDPVFVTRNSKGQVTKQDEVHSGTVFKDSTSSLSVKMNRDLDKHVFMESFNYDVHGKTVTGDTKGKISVGGKTVAAGSSVDLPNGGSVTVSKETGTSDGGFTNQYQIVIKAPNKTGDGYENITLHARKNKRGLIMYEFNVAKKSETTNEQEKVTSGFLLDAFKKEYNNQGVEEDDKDVVIA